MPGQQKPLALNLCTILVMQSTTDLLSTCIAASTSSVGAYISGVIMSLERDVGNLTCTNTRRGNDSFPRTRMVPKAACDGSAHPDADAGSDKAVSRFTAIPSGSVETATQRCASPPRLQRETRSTSESPTPSQASLASTVSPPSSRHASLSPEPKRKTAMSQRAKHTYLRDQARSDADIQQARIVQLRLDSRDQREKKLAQKNIVMVAGAGRFPRAPIFI